MMLGLMVAGCGKEGQPDTDESPKANPAKELTKEDVVGEYEMKVFGPVSLQVFLENGVNEGYLNGNKMSESKWTIANGEIHVDDSRLIKVFKINTGKSITAIAKIIEGERKPIPKDGQFTYKKIK